MDETLEPVGPGAVDTIGWLELFFDLVVVVSMALIAERLHEHHTWSGIAIFALTYVAIWLTWSSYVLYANVANEGTRTNVLVLGMVLIAIMATSLLRIEDRANVFAIAFVICRLSTGRATLRTGKLLSSWPLLELGGTTSLWVVSLWVPAPAKFILWAVSLTLDLGSTMARARTGDAAESVVDRFNQRIRQKWDKSSKRGLGRLGGGQTRDLPADGMVGADVRVGHLDERLGVFVIIVLGEAVTQLVRPAAQLDVSPALVLVALLGFGLILGLWRLTFSYGFAAAPNTQIASLPVRIGLPVHLVTTGSIVALAAALGALVSHAEDRTEASWGWIAGGALAAYVTATTAGAIATRAPRRWILGWGLPSIGFAIAVGFVAPSVSAPLLVLLLALPIGWQVAYGTRLARLAGLGANGEEIPPRRDDERGEKRR